MLNWFKKKEEVKEKPDYQFCDECGKAVRRGCLQTCLYLSPGPFFPREKNFCYSCRKKYDEIHYASRSGCEKFYKTVRFECDSKGRPIDPDFWKK